MKVNPSKFTIIFGIRGRAGKQWLKRRIIKKKQERYVEMGSPGKPLHIPVKQQMVYLGIAVSYGQFEQQTLKYRHETASLQTTSPDQDSAFLTCALKATSNTALHCVCQIYFDVWIACDWIDKSWCSQTVHLRDEKHESSCQIPSHLTRESNEDLLQRIGVNSSLEYLAKLLNSRIEKLEDDECKPWFQKKLQEIKATGRRRCKKIIVLAGLHCQCTQAYTRLHVLHVGFTLLT